MPNRIIRESARTSVTLDQLSDGAERLWWRLTTVADDYGRFNANPKIVASLCFPLRAGDRQIVRRVSGWLAELETVGGIQRYAVQGHTYGCFVNWETYQRKPLSTPRFPGPGEGQGTPDSSCQPLTATDSPCQDLTDPDTVLGVVSREVENRETRDEKGEASTSSMAPVPAKPRTLTQPSGPNGRRDRFTATSLGALWNEIVPSPKVRELTGKRLLAARRRCVEHPDLAWWRAVFEAVRDTPFLRGAKGWRATIDWVLANDTNAVRVLEGHYADGARRETAQEQLAVPSADTTRARLAALESGRAHPSVQPMLAKIGKPMPVT